MHTKALFVFDWKYSNILKYYDLKYLFSIWIYF